MVEGKPLDYLVRFLVHPSVMSLACPRVRTKKGSGMPCRVSLSNTTVILSGDLLAVLLAGTAHLTRAIPGTRSRLSFTGGLGSQEARGPWWVLLSCWYWDPQHSWWGWAAFPIPFAAVSIPGSILHLETRYPLSRATFGLPCFVKKYINFKIKTRNEVGTAPQNLTSIIPESHPQQCKPTALKCCIPWREQHCLLFLA